MMQAPALPGAFACAGSALKQDVILRGHKIGLCHPFHNNKPVAANADHGIPVHRLRIGQQHLHIVVAEAGNVIKFRSSFWSGLKPVTTLRPASSEKMNESKPAPASWNSRPSLAMNSSRPLPP